MRIGTDRSSRRWQGHGPAPLQSRRGAGPCPGDIKSRRGAGPCPADIALQRTRTVERIFSKRSRLMWGRHSWRRAGLQAGLRGAGPCPADIALQSRLMWGRHSWRRAGLQAGLCGCQSAERLSSSALAEIFSAALAEISKGQCAKDLPAANDFVFFGQRLFRQRLLRTDWLEHPYNKLRTH